MLFLVYVGQSQFRAGELLDEPTPGNGFELREYASLAEAEHYVWEDQLQYAESLGEREEEWTCDECNHQQPEGYECEVCESMSLTQDYLEEEGEYVERLTTGLIVEYDPTNKSHLEHAGYEAQRPERVKFAKAQAAEERERKIKNLKARKTKLEQEIQVINSELLKAVLS